MSTAQLDHGAPQFWKLLHKKVIVSSAIVYQVLLPTSQWLLFPQSGVSSANLNEISSSNPGRSCLSLPHSASQISLMPSHVLIKMGVIYKMVSVLHFVQCNWVLQRYICEQYHLHQMVTLIFFVYSLHHCSYYPTQHECLLWTSLLKRTYKIGMQLQDTFLFGLEYDIVLTLMTEVRVWVT